MTTGPDDKAKKTLNEIDELLANAKDLQNKSRGKTDLKVEEESGLIEDTVKTIKSIRDELSFFRRLIYNVKETFLGFYERFLAPIWAIVGPPFNWFGRQYARIWNRFAFSVDSKSGQKVLSRKKSSLLIGITFFAFMALTPTGIGDAVRFVSTEPISDALLMAFSMKTETFYLYTSEEVDPVENIHSVRGCRVEGECVEKDASYFRVKPRLAHDVWKLIEYGNPIYVPDHVVAPIAPGVNKCLVTYYGYRMTASWISRLMRSMQVYPTMLEASCTHIGT